MAALTGRETWEAPCCRFFTLWEGGVEEEVGNTLDNVIFNNTVGLQTGGQTDSRDLRETKEERGSHVDEGLREGTTIAGQGSTRAGHLIFVSQRMQRLAPTYRPMHPSIRPISYC